MQRTSFSWVALVGTVLAALVAMGAATALAARSTASPFELVVSGHYEPMCSVDDPLCDGAVRLVGTFTSGGPFCESGTALDDFEDAAFPVQRFTCTDGSGGLTLSIVSPRAGAVPGWGAGSGQWTIVEGSGRHADLRGKGTYDSELTGGDPADPATVEFRTTLHGFADTDAVAPSVAFTSAIPTKLPRLSRVYATPVYSIRVGLSLRDDVEGNTVAYKLEVTGGSGIGLYSEDGTTASGSVSTTFRVVPPSKRARSVQLQLTGSDPVGNEVSITRSLKLPRS